MTGLVDGVPVPEGTEGKEGTEGRGGQDDAGVEGGVPVPEGTGGTEGTGGQQQPGADATATTAAATVAPRRSRTALAASLVVAVIVAAFVVVLATREPSTDRQVESALIGRVAPELTGETLDGGTFDIDNHLGRWVVVNFFATWCRECVVEHPQLDSFQQKHAELGDAVVVSVLYDDDPETAAQFFEDRGGDWPVVLDDSGIAATYGVTAVPETYLVAPSGRVAYKLVGGVTQRGLEERMAAVDAVAGSESEAGG